MVTALLAFAVALGILITFHELGHYLVARLCGVKVLTFSFGFGPKLFSKRLGRDKTEWCISALPLGGYVSMLDERQEGMVVDPAEAHRAFNRQSVYKRFAIVAAGPIANILLAIIFYAIMAWSGQPEIRPVMDTPVAQSQAAQLQIQRLDQVVSFGDKKIEGLEDFNWAILEHIGESNVPLVLDRGGTRFTVDFDLRDIKIDEDSTSPFAQLGINLWYGYPVLFNIQKGSPAALAGIKDGDVVLSADGHYGLSVQELVNYIKDKGETPIRLVLQNEEGQAREVIVRPQVRAVDDGKGNLVERPVIGVNVGIKPNLIWLSKGPVDGLMAGVDRTISITKTTYKAVVQMITGEASTKNLTGPVTIADYAGKTAQMGWRVYLSFLAMISVSLGLLNLLPIPLLDGGHLLYYLVEILRGRPLPEWVMQAGQKLGLLIVLALGALALSNDFIRLIQ